MSRCGLRKVKPYRQRIFASSREGRHSAMDQHNNHTSRGGHVRQTGEKAYPKSTGESMFGRYQKECIRKSQSPLQVNMSIEEHAAESMHSPIQQHPTPTCMSDHFLPSSSPTQPPPVSSLMTPRVSVLPSAGEGGGGIYSTEDVDLVAA